LFDHKTKVMKALNATLIARKLDYIVSNLAQNKLDNCLLVKGFNPANPTFWAMEGLFPYIERTKIVELLKVVDCLSAPGSEFWIDIPGQMVADGEEWGKRAMKYGEDDPMHGVLSDISWELEEQASLGVVCEHFGRPWMPMLSPKMKQEVPFFCIIAKKP
ncbi:O-methyltransferase, partial [Phytophthora megakarya]